MSVINDASERVARRAARLAPRTPRAHVRRRAALAAQLPPPLII